jgi:hypothetical protein
LRKAACLPIFRPKDPASDKRPNEGQNMNGFLRGVCVQRNAIRFRQAFIFSIISRSPRPCKDRTSPKFIMKQCFLNLSTWGCLLTRCDVRLTATPQRLHGSAGAMPLTTRRKPSNLDRRFLNCAITRHYADEFADHHQHDFYRAVAP